MREQAKAPTTLFKGSPSLKYCKIEEMPERALPSGAPRSFEDGAPQKSQIGKMFSHWELSEEEKSHFE